MDMTLRNTITQSVKKWLWKTGHYTRTLRQMTFPGVAVLCYHGIRDDAWAPEAMPLGKWHVSASAFDAQCRLFREYCNPISLAELLSGLDDPSTLPRRPVLLTFDDGIHTWHSIGKPILQRHDLPAVFFVTTDPVKKQYPFWKTDTLFMEKQSAASTDSDDFSAPLTVEQLRDLAQTPGFTIGVHTVTHPVLTKENEKEQRRQIRESKDQVEAWVGRAVQSLSYPYGRYTDQTLRLAREEGIEVAFTTQQNFVLEGESPLTVPRFYVLPADSPHTIAHKMCYSWRGASYQDVGRRIIHDNGGRLVNGSLTAVSKA